MKIIFILICIFPSAHAIVGGKVDSNYKNIVSIRGISLCTGTVISPHVVLTAAHCTDNGRIPLEIYSYYTKKKYKPVKVIPHPTAVFSDKQSRLLKGYDISLIILNQPIEIPAQFLVPLAKKKNCKKVTDEKLQILGIGIDESGWPSGSKRIGAASMLKNPRKCGGTRPRVIHVNDMVRSGDSGGPGFCKSTNNKKVFQKSVTSARLIFDSENDYLPDDEKKNYECKNKSVLLNVSPFLRWIKKAVGYYPDVNHQKLSEQIRDKFNLKRNIKIVKNCNGIGIVPTIKDQDLEDLKDISLYLTKRCSLSITNLTNFSSKNIKDILGQKGFYFDQLPSRSSIYFKSVADNKININYKIENDENEYIIEFSSIEEFYKILKSSLVECNL